MPIKESFKLLKLLLTYLILITSLFHNFLNTSLSVRAEDNTDASNLPELNLDYKKLVKEKVGKMIAYNLGDSCTDEESKHIVINQVYSNKWQARFFVIRSFSPKCQGVHSDSPITVFRINKDGKITRVFHKWTQMASLYLSPLEDKLIINSSSTALCYGGSDIHIYQINADKTELIASTPVSEKEKSMRHQYHFFEKWLDNETISYQENNFDECKDYLVEGMFHSKYPPQTKTYKIKPDESLRLSCENGLKKHVSKSFEYLSFCYRQDWVVRGDFTKPDKDDAYIGDITITNPKNRITLKPGRIIGGIDGSTVCTIGLNQIKTLDNGLIAVPFDEVTDYSGNLPKIVNRTSYGYVQGEPSDQADYILEFENNTIKQIYNYQKLGFSSTAYRPKADKCFSKAFSPIYKSVPIPTTGTGEFGRGGIVDTINIEVDGELEAEEIINSICWTTENCTKRDEKQKKTIEEKLAVFNDDDPNNDYFPDPYDCQKFFDDKILVPENSEIRKTCFGEEAEDSDIEQELSSYQLKQEVENKSEGFIKEVWKNTSEDVFTCVMDTTGRKENKEFIDHLADTLDFGIEAIPLIGNAYQIGKGWSGWGITGEQSCVDKWANKAFGLGGLAWGAGKGVAGCVTAGGVASITGVGAIVGCGVGGLTGAASGKVEEKVAKAAIKETLKKGGRNILVELGSRSLVKVVRNALTEGIKTKIFVEVIDGSIKLIFNRSDGDSLHEFNEEIKEEDVEIAVNESNNPELQYFGLRAYALDLNKYNGVRKAFKISVKNGKTFVVKIPTRLKKLSKKQKQAIEDLTKLIDNKEVGESYETLAKATAGWRGCKNGGCFQVHHLLEVRMVKNLNPSKFFKIKLADINTKIPCLVMTQQAHLEITNHLRKLIPFGKGYDDIKSIEQATAYYEAAYKKAGLRDIYIKHVEPLFKDFDKNSAEYTKHFEEATKVLN